MHIFALGERLTDDEADAIFKDCLGPEDDDGFIQYARKYFSMLSWSTEFSQGHDM